MLYPLIDDMLECRKTYIEKVNDMFDLNIQVKLNSSWKDNQIELELEQKSIIGDNSEYSETIEDETIEDETIEDETIEDETIEDETIEDETIEDETIEDETIEDETIEDETIEDETIEDEQIEKITDVVIDIIEQVEENINGDNENETADNE
jgi:hypothetical protein